MDHDDYYVITYRLLKYLYECLKTAARPKEEVLRADFFDIPEAYWEYIVSHLYTDGYVEGVNVSRYLHKSGLSVNGIKNISITPKGIEYLSENSMFQKIKGYVKDITDILPF